MCFCTGPACKACPNQSIAHDCFRARPESDVHGRQQHKKVADAIIGGRSVAAGEAMRKLIQEALDLINKREAAQVARRLAANAPR